MPMGCRSKSICRIFDREIEHPVLCTPIDLFVREDLYVRLSIGTRRFLLNHSAPLPVNQVLKLGTNMCGLIAYLYEQGITLDEMFIGNFLVRSQIMTFYFSIQISAHFTMALYQSLKEDVSANLALILQRFLSVEHKELPVFFRDHKRKLFLHL